MNLLKSIAASLAAALMLGLAAASPANAQLQGEAEMTALVAKSQVHQKLMVEAQSIFIDTLDQINLAIEKGEQPLSKAEAQAWSSAWETRTRARLAALKAGMAAAPRITTEEVQAVLGSSENKGLVEVMVKGPKLVEDTLAAAERTVNQTATLAPLAAAGDEVAIDKLIREMLAVGLYVVEIENQGLRTGIASLSPGHPQRSLAQSILATNLAAMEIQRVTLRAYNGEPLEADAAARRARAHLAEAETAARRIPAEAKASIDLVAKDAPPEAEGLLDKMRKAFATYEQSSQVEIDGLGPLREAIDALVREDFEGITAAMDKSDSLYDRRIALQLERSSYLSQ